MAQKDIDGLLVGGASLDACPSERSSTIEMKGFERAYLYQHNPRFGLHFLIIIVLLQRAKGPAWGGLRRFEPDALRQLRSRHAARKMTTAVAVVFMLTSLWLAYFAVHKGRSVMQGAAPVPIEQTVPAPVVPPAPAPEKK